MYAEYTRENALSMHKNKTKKNTESWTAAGRQQSDSNESAEENTRTKRRERIFNVAETEENKNRDANEYRTAESLGVRV